MMRDGRGRPGFSLPRQRAMRKNFVKANAAKTVIFIPDSEGHPQYPVKIKLKMFMLVVVLLYLGWGLWGLVIL